ncbi:MAG: hypothetical protein AB7F75_03900 [Planctomycetota bacterium]
MQRHMPWMSFSALVCGVLIWLMGVGRPVQAGVDVLFDGKNTTTVYLLNGDHVIVVDADKHNILVYSRGSGALKLIGVRNYTYDLLLAEHPSEATTTLQDTRVGAVASYVKSLYENDKDWISHKKTLKNMSKSEIDKELSTFVKGKVKGSGGKTTVLTLQSNSAQIPHAFLIMDAANEMFLLYDINPAGPSACKLLSARNISHDFQISKYFDSVDQCFGENGTVSAVKKIIEDAKKAEEEKNAK